MSPRAMRSPARCLIAVLLAALGLALAAPAGHAHDNLLASNPADGATLDAGPAEVVLTFSDEILPIAPSVLVRDAAGAVVLDAEPTVAGPVATAPFPADLAPGAYEVTWRVVSRDGHPIQGAFTFTVSGAPEPAGPVVEATQSTAPAVATTPGDTPAPGDTLASSAAPPSGTPDEAGGNGGSIPLAVAGLAALGAVGAVVILRLRRRNLP